MLYLFTIDFPIENALLNIYEINFNDVVPFQLKHVYMVINNVTSVLRTRKCFLTLVYPDGTVKYH